jgi:DNA polymerase-4/protein ImuB
MLEVKILCLLLPHFSLRCEVSRQPQLGGMPAVVVRESGSQKLVLDHAPELTDLQPQMDLQQALSRHDDIRIIHADAAYYSRCFNLILDALETTTPVVEGPEPGLAYLGMDGMQLLYKKDEDFVNAVRAVVPRDFITKAGLGRSKFLAYLAARQSTENSSFRTLYNDLSSLKDLPCDVLPVSPRSLKKLREFGLRTLGQIAGFPPGPLQAQFGPEGKRIWELAQGRDATPLYPRALEQAVEESITLNWVTTSVEALLSTMEALLVKALAGRDFHGRGITCLDIWTQGGDSRRWEKTVNFKEPAMAARSALPRLRYFLENYPQPGPVEQVGIRIIRLGYGAGRQQSIFSTVRSRDNLMEDIKQLDFRLGDHQVYHVKEIEPWSRIPERRYALAPLNQ